MQSMLTPNDSISQALFDQYDCIVIDIDDVNDL